MLIFSIKSHPMSALYSSAVCSFNSCLLFWASLRETCGIYPLFVSYKQVLIIHSVICASSLATVSQSLWECVCSNASRCWFSSCETDLRTVTVWTVSHSTKWVTQQVKLNQCRVSSWAVNDPDHGTVHKEQQEQYILQVITKIWQMEMSQFG